MGALGPAFGLARAPRGHRRWARSTCPYSPRLCEKLARGVSATGATQTRLESRLRAQPRRWWIPPRTSAASAADVRTAAHFGVAQRAYPVGTRQGGGYEALGPSPPPLPLRAPRDRG